MLSLFLLFQLFVFAFLEENGVLSSPFACPKKWLCLFLLARVLSYSRLILVLVLDLYLFVFSMASSRKSMLLATSGRNTGCPVYCLVFVLCCLVLSCLVLSYLVVSCLVMCCLAVVLSCRYRWLSWLLPLLLQLSWSCLIFRPNLLSCLQMPLWFVLTRTRGPRSRASKAIRFSWSCDCLVLPCPVLSYLILTFLLSESCLYLGLSCLCQSSSGALDVVGEIHPFLGERNVSHMGPFSLCSLVLSCVVFVVCLSVYISLCLSLVVVVVFLFLLSF
jgi:hypothetical protein